MHSRHLALLMIALVAATGCGPEPRETSRASTPMFKGVELYSWVDPATQGWRFALLPGTNREKTVQEVVAASGVDSVRELKGRLSELARGETVFWVVLPSGGSAIPPESVVKDIVAHGAEIGVTVEVARR